VWHEHIMWHTRQAVICMSVFASPTLDSRYDRHVSSSLASGRCHRHDGLTMAWPSIMTQTRLRLARRNMRCEPVHGRCKASVENARREIGAELGMRWAVCREDLFLCSRQTASRR
jgi:hypothetical protein